MYFCPAANELLNLSRHFSCSGTNDTHNFLTMHFSREQVVRAISRQTHQLGSERFAQHFHEYKFAREQMVCTLDTSSCICSIANELPTFPTQVLCVFVRETIFRPFHLVFSSSENEMIVRLSVLSHRKETYVHTNEHELRNTNQELTHLTHQELEHHTHHKYTRPYRAEPHCQLQRERGPGWQQLRRATQ